MEENENDRQLKEQETNRIDKKQINQIESLTKIPFNKVIFDSKTSNCEYSTKDFYQKVFGKDNLLFIVEDTENNIFGAYINVKINKYIYKEGDKYKGERVSDENAFVFSLQSNGRLVEPTKFDIFEEDSRNAFTLYNDTCDELFTVGDGYDICIMKDHCKETSYCHQISFYYGEKQNILVGKEGEDNSFTVQRIQVWQMDNEIDKKNQIKYRKSIEELSLLKYKETIFDSDVDDCDVNTSVFDQKIFGKEKLIFIIRDTNENVFGFYINAKIDDWYYKEDNKWKGKNLVI